ncbi:hypothetical protein [uncultured Gammaproteobacteria bacterium]|nr:hypothetical protein [uncultured Gammaproteobacteria bacterium]
MSKCSLYIFAKQAKKNLSDKHLLICLILPIFKAIIACGIQRYVVGGFGI